MHNLDVDGDGKPTVEDMLVTFRLCNVAGANAAGEAPQRSPSAHIIRTYHPHMIRTYHPHMIRTYHPHISYAHIIRT